MELGHSLDVGCWHLVLQVACVQLHPEKLRQSLEPLFRENFERFGDLGAAVSVWQNGAEVLEFHGGFRDAQRSQPWSDDTLVLVWSATKGVGSACLLHVLQEHGIKLQQRVAAFWPEFAHNGKADVTIAQLMSHSAGLCALDQRVDILDYDAVVHALEQQEPLWPPGTAHGYHVRTFGFLLDELARRIAGVGISEYWRSNLAEPMQLDFWIGLPHDLNPRVATIYAAKAGRRPPEPAQFYRDVAKPGTFQHRTFTSPAGLSAVSAMNSPDMRARPIVSLGGIGSARALAKFYGMLANEGRLDGRQYFSQETIQHMAKALAVGKDRVFEIDTAFSAGFMVDPPNRAEKRFGTVGQSFGHPGAGGCHAFADAQHKLSFAYVMNQMEQTVLPNERTIRLVSAVYAQ